MTWFNGVQRWICLSTSDVRLAFIANVTVGFSAFLLFERADKTEGRERGNPL